MLDISYIRENEKEVRENLTRRKKPEYIKLLDLALSIDKQWRGAKTETDKLRSRKNKISQEINTAKKTGKDAKKLILEVSELPKKLETKELEVNALGEKRRALLLSIPNMMHKSVPYGSDDSENQLVILVGEKPKFNFKPQSHVDLLSKWDLADLTRAAKISGARWYFLKGKLAVLDLALVQYAMDFMRLKGFTPIIPPYMMNRNAYEGVTSLEDFKDVMYKIDSEDLYAIATAEHPLTAMYMNEVLEDKQLPKKMAGFSPCFRSEAGSHGKDTKGIFRVHQFNKVEQVVLCKPENSWEIHEELLENSKEFFSNLGLHFRIVNICTGDLGIVAAKKYDIEVWYPVQNAYREVVSCSNCTNYQSNRLSIRYQEGKTRKAIHTLNSTCVATTRALAAIIENFQDKNGIIHIPKVLQKYTGFKTIGGE